MHGRKGIGKCWKRSKILFWSNEGAKKDIMDVKNINVLIGENEISYSKSNGNENDFINNL